MSHHYEDEEVPMIQLLSFNKLLAHYEQEAQNQGSVHADRAKTILAAAAAHPELREGFNDFSKLAEKREVIDTILADAFSPALTKNEIKTAGLPYYNQIIKSSERFQTILQDAGPEFELELRNTPIDAMYIMMSTVILAAYYGFQLDYNRPLFYDIPDKNGVMRHYRILYNADFMEIEPTERSKELTQSDVDELLADSKNLDLWMEKIPPKSFMVKGFVISNIFDVTAEYSISQIKSNLIGNKEKGDVHFAENVQATFRSLFKLKDIMVGFSRYDKETDSFERVQGPGFNSFLVNNTDKKTCHMALCDYSYGQLIKNAEVLVVSNLEKIYGKSASEPYKSLIDQGLKSVILAPISEGKDLLGVLEIVSPNINELNSINAIKLEDVLPYITAAVQRNFEEEQNLIDAIIQNECTTVHSSVYWKFQQEAKRFMISQELGEQPVFEEIVFRNVYPLYGQIDIKDSSKERNQAIQRDLLIQLSSIRNILAEAFKLLGLPIYEEMVFRVNNQMEEINDTLYSNSEQAIFDFVQEDVTPVFHHLKQENETLAQMIKAYEEAIDTETRSYYDHRKNYDKSVMEINLHLASHLDRRQEEAQAMFPHYFERYKTDGVEHNLYIGSDIAKGREFNTLHLKSLRLWQLQVMVEMENVHYKLKPNLTMHLDVASLLLVYSTPLAIRFRMDEKRFDVDGTYNARYEIIKKRIDKSFIKGKNERLTQAGKLAIVYSQRKDEREYLRYVTFLKSKGYFTNNIEIVELEGLQGVTGLKAIRAEILYRKEEDPKTTYTYQDLIDSIKD